MPQIAKNLLYLSKLNIKGFYFCLQCLPNSQAPMRYHLLKSVSQVILLSLHASADIEVAEIMRRELPIATYFRRLPNGISNHSNNFEERTATKESQNVDVLGKGLSSSANQQDEPVFTVVEQMPEFPGGAISMHRYINANVKEREFAPNTRVSFIVNTDGSIQDVTIIESQCPKCDEALIKAIKSMPRWRPGSQSGRKVRVRYVLVTQPTRR
jgi:hypothetical protein